jgi:hypothetical protein
VIGLLGGAWFYLRSLGGHYGLDTARKDNTAGGYHSYIRYGGDPGDVRDDLAAVHDRTRSHLAAAGARRDGLDVFLVPLLWRIDHRVFLDGSGWTIDAASFDAFAKTLPPADDLAPHLPGSLDMMTGSAGVAAIAEHLRFLHCSTGFTTAFAAVTGDDTVTFDDGDSILDVPDDPPSRLPRVEVHASVRASGNAYLAPLSRTIMPGMRLVGELVLVDESGELGRVPIDIAPPDSIQFTTIGGVPFGADEGDVAGGMVATACTSAGLALANAMAGWAPSLEAAVSGSAAR